MNKNVIRNKSRTRDGLKSPSVSIGFGDLCFNLCLPIFYTIIQKIFLWSATTYNDCNMSSNHLYLVLINYFLCQFIYQYLNI